MKCLVILVTLAATVAAPAASMPVLPVFTNVYGASARPIIPLPGLFPDARNFLTSSSQYHVQQDELGNAQYGYSDVNSVKQELADASGGVTGSYHYIDANGKVQTVNYVSDELGFRAADPRLTTTMPPAVGATRSAKPPFVGPMPVADTLEVARAREAFLKEFEAIKTETDDHHSVEKRSALSDPQVVYGYNALPYTYGAGYYTPLLAYHSYKYPYVAGYGPGAVSYYYSH